MCIQLNWIEFNQIEISLTMLNPKEKNIIFSSIHFNLEIWIQLKFNWITSNSS
jgi:hypothetical protein